MKTVPFKMPLKPVDLGDAWVKARDSVEWAPAATPAVPVDAMKRFTIDVTASLHMRIKSQCALRGTKMADVLRDMLEREFPQS